MYINIEEAIGILARSMKENIDYLREFSREDIERAVDGAVNKYVDGIYAGVEIWGGTELLKKSIEEVTLKDDLTTYKVNKWWKSKGRKIEQGEYQDRYLRYYMIQEIVRQLIEERDGYLN